MAKKYTRLPYIFWVLIVYLLCIAGGIIWFGFKSSPITKPAGPATRLLIPTPTPTPIKLPPGKGTYAVSQGKHDGPTISQVSFDPLDVHSGQTLTITLQIANATPVQTIQGSLLTDTSTKKLTFTYVNRTGTSESWQTIIPITDTLWYRYTLQITAQGTNGISHIVITPR